MFFFTIKFCLWTVFWWHLSGGSPPSRRTAVGGFTEGRAGPRLPTAPWELQAGGESHWARTRRLSTQHCRQRASASPGPRPRGARWSQTTAVLELGWAAAEEQGPRARSFCSGGTRRAPPLGSRKPCCGLLDRPHVTDSWGRWAHGACLCRAQPTGVHGHFANCPLSVLEKLPLCCCNK